MPKHFIGMKPSHFKKALSIIKKLEKNNGPISVDGSTLSSFLLANAHPINDSHDPVDIRTKRRILITAGDFTSNPASLQRAVKLKENLQYGPDEYIMLQSRLDALVKEYKKTAAITADEAGEWETVGDCVDTVEEKIK